MIRRAEKAIRRLIGMRVVEDYIQQMIQRGDCHTALDIGCGYMSRLSRLRPGIRTVGVDASPEALAEARALGQHDDYVLADIQKLNPETLLERFDGRPFDLVTLFDVIEHLPKRQGYELLEKCERLTSKYILVQTPNGFMEQGPDYGNEFMRHLSGWFPHDFKGLAYTVYGSGTKVLRGYAATPRYNFPGVMRCDEVLAWLMRVEKKPHRALALIAIKDVRGVPARLGTALPRSSAPQPTGR
jgi:2-polyprenyl-3-methyl-5-hydroxy-6-metoxy-1,4-benzoquinol methylase